MKAKSFLFYDSDLEALKFLSTEQAGLLFKAIAKYRLENEETYFENDTALNIMFFQIKAHIDINTTKYNETINKRKIAASKRWNNAERKDSSYDISAYERKGIEFIHSHSNTISSPETI